MADDQISRSQEKSIDLFLPLEFDGELKYKFVDGHHLWVIVDTGAFCVFSDNENALFQELVANTPPAEVAANTVLSSLEDLSVDITFQAIQALILKVAKVGFLRGVEGAHFADRPPSPEKHARFHITHACQLSCIHCYTSSSPLVDRTKELTTKRWKALIDEFAVGGGSSILFSGGEPLLRSDCCEIFEQSKSYGITNRLLTNGLLIPKYIDRLKNSIDSLQVSLGSPEEISNDAIRGQGTFRKIVAALDALVDTGLTRTTLKVQVNITAMEDNLVAIKQHLLDFTEPYRANGIEFDIGNGVMKLGRGAEMEDKTDGMVVKNQLAEILMALSSPQKHIATKNTGNCGYCHRLVVNPEGYIYSCHLMEDRIGHIDDKPLLDWYPTLINIARNHEVEEVAICKDCDIRRTCGGTCRIINRHNTGCKMETYCTSEWRDTSYHDIVQFALKREC